MFEKLRSFAFVLSLALSAQAHAAGAIAVDDEAGARSNEIGWGIGFGKTREAAAREAMRQCRAAGNENCQVKVRFDSCGAYAVSTNYFGIGFGTTLARAERMALDECGRSSCKVVLSECDE